MISFEEAYRIVLDHARPLSTETVKIDQSLGRVLAEDVRADMDMPPFDKSAMDGYACRKEDLPGPLRVMEVIPAGEAPRCAISAGQCSKIMTGAPVPEGADCVIMIEYTETVENPDVESVRFTAEDTADNICIQGEDVKTGQIVLQRGTVIEPQHIAVMATFGCVEPKVSIRPKVGIIATGDELVEPDRKPNRSQIRTSNSYQLCAQVRRAGCIDHYYGIARDELDSIDALMKKAAAENDVILLSGGVSMGDYDLVPGVMKDNGFELLFDSVATKPGKPTTFGVSRSGWCFGLPGNPVSTFIQFMLLIEPFLYRLMGHDFRRKSFLAPLAADYRRKKTGREAWLPVRLDREGRVELCDYHGSAHINALTIADGLISVPVGVASIEKGERVLVRLF